MSIVCLHLKNLRTWNVSLVGEYQRRSLQQKRIIHFYFVEQIAKVIGRGALVLSRDIHHIQQHLKSNTLRNTITVRIVLRRFDEPIQ